MNSIKYYVKYNLKFIIKNIIQSYIIEYKLIYNNFKNLWIEEKVKKHITASSQNLTSRQ